MGGPRMMRRRSLTLFPLCRHQFRRLHLPSLMHHGFPRLPAGDAQFMAAQSTAKLPTAMLTSPACAVSTLMATRSVPTVELSPRTSFPSIGCLTVASAPAPSTADTMVSALAVDPWRSLLVWRHPLDGKQLTLPRPMLLLTRLLGQCP